MMMTDRDALLCDMAETYGIYDLRSLPAETIATLAAGLRDDSRIKLKMHGAERLRQDVLLAMICDALTCIFGKEDDNKQYMTDIALGKKQTEESDLKGFDSPSEYEKYRRLLIGG